MLTRIKKRFAVLGYIGGASVASVFLMGSFCDKDPDCYVGNANIGPRPTAACAKANEDYAKAIAVNQAAAAEAPSPPPPPPPKPPKPMEGMQGGMEGGMQG